MQTKIKVFLTIMAALVFAAAFVTGSSAGEGQKTEKESNVVKEGSVVWVHYTLTVEGSVVDSSRDGNPLEFQVGSGRLIPGFEKAVVGMKAGEKKSFEVSPENGYGPVNPDALQEVPKDRLAPDVKPEAGMRLYARGPNGESIPVRIAEVREDVVVIDFNHPLAGKTLNFDVEIIEVE